VHKPEISRSLLAGVALALMAGAVSAQTTRYDIGAVSPEEQFYVELINRARANPVAEGLRLANLGSIDDDVDRNYDFFRVDLAMMQAEMSLLPPAQPLAPNRLLHKAAVKHSRDMATTGVQTHTGSDGSTIGQRVKREGYNFNRVTENIYTTSANGQHGHAGFVVDWGDDGGAGGMQMGRGHRRNAHDPDARELGMGVVETNKPGVGPQVVTQVFGTINSSGPFVTGVAHLDLDGDDFYTPGEGVGGVTVTVSGSAFHARTVPGGGFAVPLPGDGTYELRFRAPGMRSVVRPLTIAHSQNAKIDLRAAYDPSLSGPSRPAIGQASVYTIAQVAGATGYRLRAGRLRSSRAEGAEDGQRRVEISQTGTYNVVQSLVKAEGTRSFQLAHPTKETQAIRLTPLFVPGLSGKLVFHSRLGLASVGQSAVVEILSEGRWEEVFRQSGTSTATSANFGETVFKEVTVDLARFANIEIEVRFRYVAAGRSVFYDLVDDRAGWFIDSIRLPGVHEIFLDRAIRANRTRKVSFKPDHHGAWWLRAQAKVSGKFLRTGPGTIVTVPAP